MRVSSAVTLAAGFCLAAGSIFAGPLGTVSDIVAFGDSLSDSGSASIATGGAYPGSGGYYYRTVPGVPFQVGEFTNAPTAGGPAGVWVDQLAPKLGVPVAQPFFPPSGGTNYAVASAVTGSTGLANVDAELTAFNLVTGGKAPSSALYTVWAGANDILNITDPVAAMFTGVTAADNLYKNILTLSGEGARYFLWANLPDLGKTPDGIAAGGSASLVLTAASSYFDAEFAVDLMKLQSAGISVVGLDIQSLFASLEAAPSNYGFTNITDPAISTPGANPANYLFWDGVHPTAAADTFIADAAFDALVATPEPAALGLAAIGLSALFAAAARTRRKQQRG